MTGPNVDPILKAIRSGATLHWKDASRDGLAVLELYAEGKA